MRRQKVEKLGDVISQYLKALRIDKKVKQVSLISSWEEIIGRNVARATSEIFFKKRILFVYINSAVIRNELLMIKDELKKRLNEHAGENLVDDIVIR
jgi:predicted nucleic acid-binding Zn ribbon protein